MKTCDQIQSDFIEALYGDLDQIRQQGFDTHLGVCPTCAAQFTALRSTLDIIDQSGLGEPEPNFWDDLAARIKTRAADHEEPSDSPDPPVALRPRLMPVRFERRLGAGVPYWATRAVAAVAILAIGITIGRLSTGPTPPDLAQLGTTSLVDIDVSTDALPRRVTSYIQQCQTLLLGIVNLDPAADGFDAFDLGPHQRISQQLAQEAHLLQRDLAGTGERRLARLVLELQDTLLQIASLEAPDRVEGLRLVREQVQQRALLLKIHLETTRREAPPRDAGSSGRSNTRGSV